MRRPKRRTVSAISLVLLAAIFVVAAVTARGYPAADLLLHDGGIWVTNRDQGYFGRFNRPIEQLDVALSPGTTGIPDFDLLQEDADVFLIDRNAGLLRKVLVADIEISSVGPALPTEAQVALGGGVVAVIDRSNGKLWVRSTDRIVDLDISTDEPTATVGAEASVTVGLDGVVHAFSAGEDRMVSVRPDGTKQNRGFGQDVKAGEITAVGPDPVILDETGRLFLPGKVVTVPGRLPRVQQPGPAAGGVIVATEQTLLEFDLSRGGVNTLAEGGSGEPAAPVRLGPCVHAAWGGNQASYVRRCGATTSDPVRLTESDSASELVFRVNRDSVVLNDIVSGSVYLFERGGENLGNWQKAIEQAKPDPNDDQNNAQKDNAKNTPPKAIDDSLGARPGQATVLHVLDNDSDPDGDLLVVQSVTSVKPAGAGRIAIVHNGQALQYLAPPGDQISQVRFKYTIDDGRGGKSSANVVVDVNRTGNRPPAQRQIPEPLVVEQGGSVSYNVLRDWRDRDGDPLALVGATIPAPDRVHFTPDGEVTVTAAPGSLGPKTVQLRISDGETEVEGKLQVSVVDRDLPPKAQDDLFTGTAGQMVTLHPLRNDIDPNTTVPGGEQRLRLSFVQPAVPGTTVTPDWLLGTISFTAARPGTYYMAYKVTDGKGESEARMRVDVRPSSADHQPVAMADNAVLYGDSPTTIDVLGNDVDLDGDILLVSTVQVPANSGLAVAIIEHRWLRITAAQANFGAERSSVRYVVSDGLHHDTGVVTVTRRALPPENQPPIAQPDVATARAGDVVTIDVLGNDFDPDGTPMKLEPQVVPDDPDLGKWMGAGGVVRFHAPKTAGSITASYTVRDERGASAVGQVTVVVVPEDAPNQIPQPPPISARVFAGSTIRLDIPLTGVDPDGDSVLLLGPVQAPELGRIVEVGIDYIDFEAYPGAGGTDVFAYRVLDTFGGRGTGTIRIGVVPQPTRNSAPVAVDDILIVSPGTTVRVPVMANDSDVDNDPLRLEPLDLINPIVDEGTSTTEDRVVMTSGPRQGDVVAIRYSVSDGRGQRAAAALTLIAQEGANLAPLARDDMADPVPKGTTSVMVDVLANDDDIDGLRSDLEVTPIDLGDAPETIVNADGTLKIALTALPRQVAYQIKDAKGGIAVAFVRVPGTANQPPMPRPNAPPLVIPSGGELVVDILTLLMDPEGAALRLTSAAAVTVSPPLGVTLVPDSITEMQFKLSALPEYVGPAAVVFEVSDGEIAVSVSVPIVVTPPIGTPPVFSCPPAEPTAGHPPVTIDLPRCVKAYAPGALSFSDVTPAPPGVTAQLRGAQLLISAAPDAEIGERGTVKVRVTDSSGASAVGDVGIIVHPSGLAVANTDTLDGVKAGTDARVDVTANDVNPFPTVPLKVLAVTQLSGESMTYRLEDDQRTVVVHPTKVGRATLQYRLRDATNDRDREVVGLIVVNVIDRPAAPGQPIVRTVGDRFAILAWSEPAANGAPIQSYRVTGDHGFSQACFITVCQLNGLTNGLIYTFRVAATNAAGTSDPSPPSGPANPDAKPGRPDPPTTEFGDSQITVSWTPPDTNGGSAIAGYEVEISPPVGGGAKNVSGTSVVWSGLTNGSAYTFRVRARNSNLISDWSGWSAPEIPAREPNQPDAPTATPISDGIGQQIVVNWEAPADNGAPISSYRLAVFRNGTRERTITVPGDVTTETVSVDNGVQYRFRVVAVNKAGPSQESGPSPVIVAHGDPFQVVTHTYSATVGGAGANGRVAYTLTPPDDNGRAISRYDFDINNDGTPDRTGTAASGFVTGLTNGTTYSIRVRACNTGCGVWSAAGNPVVPYGPPNTPNAGAAKSGSTQIVLSWSHNGPNGRPLDHMEIRVNGGGWENVGLSGGNRTVGNGHDQTHRIEVRVFDTTGQVSATASAQATTDSPAPPPPPPSASVGVGRGGSAVGQPNCTHPSCAFIAVSLNNFPANQTISCTIRSHIGTFGNYNLNTDGSGNASGQSPYYFGYPDGWIEATCNGITGRRDPWA